MSYKPKPILSLLTGIILFNTGCFKFNHVKPVQNATRDQVSTMGSNLMQVIEGGFGGFNLNNGVTAAAQLGITSNASNTSLTLSYLNNASLCGKTTDTSVNYSQLIYGDQSAVTMHYTLTYMCANGYTAGFNVKDTLAATPSANIAHYTIGQNITLQHLYPNDPNSLLQLDGNINYHLIFTVGGGEIYEYKLNSAVFNFSDDDMKSGTATFHMKAIQGGWDYSGTMEFYGNHNAKCIINNVVYYITL